MPAPGQPVRDLAFRRRLEAVKGWAIALLVALIPFVLPTLLKTVAPQLGPPLGPQLLRATKPIALYLPWGCWGLAALIAWQNWQVWQKAKRADQGAAGEVAIAQLLAPLQQQGWTLEYNVRHPAVGDIDIVARSPKGKLFTIDVKSHRGKVSGDSKTIFRIYDRSQRPFEKDFIAQAKRQAQTLQQARKVTQVTPLIVFSNALLDLPQNPVHGVHITSSQTLRSALLSLG